MAGQERIAPSTMGNPGRTFRTQTRYRVNINRDAAARQFSQRGGAKGFTGAFGRVDGGQGAGSFGFDANKGAVPAELTMAQARKMDKLGLLMSGDNAFGGDKHPRQSRHLFAAPHIVVDLRDMDRLAQGYYGIATRIQKGGEVISRAINHGLRKLRTEVRRDLSRWTGLKAQNKIHESISLAWSTPAFLTGVLKVKAGHTVVTKDYYGASWNRNNPGATHKAWNRGQLAKGTFMVPGLKPIFKRTTGQRLPIAPIWGPNLAREVERHQTEVQAKVTAIGIVVSREAARLMSVAISQAKP